MCNCTKNQFITFLNEFTPLERKAMLIVLICLIFPYLIPGVLVYYGIKWHEGIHRNEGK